MNYYSSHGSSYTQSKPEMSVQCESENRLEPEKNNRQSETLSEPAPYPKFLNNIPTAIVSNLDPKPK